MAKNRVRVKNEGNLNSPDSAPFQHLIPTGCVMPFAGAIAASTTLSGATVTITDPTVTTDSMVIGQTVYSPYVSAGTTVLNILSSTTFQITPPATALSTAQYMVVAPYGWLMCDGAAVSRTTYSALFRTLGTRYGTGDGITTFNLPDLRGRTIAGTDIGLVTGRLTSAGAGIDSSNAGPAGGSQTHTLSSAELAIHSHVIGGNTTGISIPTGGSHSHLTNLKHVGAANDGLYGASTVPNPGALSVATASGGVGDNPIKVYDSQDTTHSHSVSDPSHTHSISNAGANSPHNNVQPTIVINYIIKW